MTIRLSQLTMEKVGLTITTTADPDANPLCDWAVHLFRSQRLQYLLAVNTTSLFPVVLAGRGITSEKTFLEAFIPAVQGQHRAVGLAEGFERFIAPSAHDITWPKVGNRRVTGSMNEIILFAKAMLEDAAWNQQTLTLEELAVELSGTILTFTSYLKLREAHRNLIESLH